MKLNHADARRGRAFDALSEATVQLSPMESDRWQFTAGELNRHFITANITDDWLVLEAQFPSPARGAESSWETLERNASLAGLAKLVLDANGGLGLRAEIPLVEGADFAARIREVQTGFNSVWFPPETTTENDPSHEAVEQRPDLKSLCAEAGWAFAERNGGKVAVELDVPGGFYQAHLIPINQSLQVTCELLPLDSFSEKIRMSMANLLLGASAFVRMARASIRNSQSSPVAQFEVRFGNAPSPSELSSALECLSTGCSLCGEEIKMLQSPAVAERHLALRGNGANARIRQMKGQ